ncbi:hypothetical protein RXV86_05915 [Alisedimentitalea sp. MJ-SS2]|uniref:hypothetical protein n=1 Tax=Aliisedimentitalea sp. MJ-SS2 TaxID=3049795 RepID=UPI0029103F38|nr:hypothetical protein [Alisedimentitalea sp. MJ-SS2]MDU8926913.1 hypothetical protein [Alisedimentitalea sp. MJ-SS2]
MKPKASLLGLIFAFLMANLASAQGVIGTAVVSGKKIEILEDRTWRYAETGTADACIPANHGVRFCGERRNWKRQFNGLRDFSLLFDHSSKISGGIIIEDVGLRDGIEMETMREVALGGAADASGVAIEEVPVLDVLTAEVDGHPAETIIYGAKPLKLGFVYANTIVLLEDRTLQILVWAFGKEFTEEHEKWHADFIGNVRIQTEEETH